MMGGFYSETECFFWDEALGYVLPVVMFIFDNSPFSFSRLFHVYIHSLVIVYIGSFLYGLFAINNGHHAPDIPHQGDEFDSLDFGIFQVRAVHDREEVDRHLLTVLAFFGTHTLHHLFPTVDHAVLPHLQEIFETTCKEFGIEIKRTTMLNAFKDQITQLSRTETIKLHK